MRKLSAAVIICLFSIAGFSFAWIGAAGQETGEILQPDGSASGYRAELASISESMKKAKGTHEPYLAPDSIDPARGASGALFSQTVEEVVNVWGRPDFIGRGRIVGVEEPLLALGYPHRLSTVFLFMDNRLVGITLMEDNKGSFPNGIGVGASLDEVLAVFGDEAEITGHGKFRAAVYTDIQGTKIKLYFEDDGLCMISLYRSAAGGAKDVESGSYYSRLETQLLDVDAPDTGAEIDLGDSIINPGTGLSILPFGSGMDQAVALWGKPYEIKLFRNTVILDYYQGPHCTFTNNRLVGLYLNLVPGVIFANGLGFGSTIAEIKEAFGKPDRESEGYWLSYYNIANNRLRLVFDRKTQELKVIEIKRRSGRMGGKQG